MSTSVNLKHKTNKILNKLHVNINRLFFRFRKINISYALQILIILFILYCIYNYIQHNYNSNTILDFSFVTTLLNSYNDKNDKNNKNNNNKNNNTNSENDLKFYKCSKYLNNKPTELGLHEVGYSKITDKSGNWELYVPCGYNYVEDELREMEDDY